MEIQTIINLLKVLDNPIDDIALVSVLRSQIGGFSDNEIEATNLCFKLDSGEYIDKFRNTKNSISM